MPSISLIDERQKLLNMIGEAVQVSGGFDGRSSQKPNTAMMGWSSYIFGRAIRTSMTLVDICDQDSDRIGIDHFTCAATCRTIVEASVMCSYLGDPDIDEDLYWLKKWIVDLHDATNRYRMFKPINHLFENQADGEPWTREMLELARSQINPKIQENRFFKEFPEQKRNQLLDGQRFYIEQANKIAEQYGFAADYYEHVVSYMSAFVHSAPLSFHRVEDQFSGFHTTSEYQSRLAATACMYSAGFLKQATQNMRSNHKKLFA